VSQERSQAGAHYARERFDCRREQIFSRSAVTGHPSSCRSVSETVRDRADQYVNLTIVAPSFGVPVVGVG
jgi:hypothetical protein